MTMTDPSGLGLIQYEDFNKICRLCCKRTKDLTPIHQKIEESSNDLWDSDIPDSDAIVIMLLKIGLSVIICHIVCTMLDHQLKIIL